jgi:hypothetical protein
MQPELLMFLGQLKKLNIINGAEHRYHTIERHLADPTFGGETVDMITQGIQEYRKKYIVVRHWAENLPFEERRKGITRSEIVLAFPVQDSVTPIIQNQRVFAFLPIADFGFTVCQHVPRATGCKPVAQAISTIK